MQDPRERNRRVIEEFRANRGIVGGQQAGRPLLLLTTIGAKSHKPYTTPVMYLRDGDRLAIFATHGGSPTHPDWYHNLVANPMVTVEIGAERYSARATVASGTDRDALYARQAQLFPQFADYQRKTSRIIPVVILQRTEEA
ncbi:MAG TPA: nitroreductase family deazaflavin-dependent oxidoreductase [Chloroflexota bacterium]|nr:nitroreductase family deazaflavin-dependent oxidoreductase [Chloroflexota bacterium]